MRYGDLTSGLAGQGFAAAIGPLAAVPVLSSPVNVARFLQHRYCPADRETRYLRMGEVPASG